MFLSLNLIYIAKKVSIFNIEKIFHTFCPIFMFKQFIEVKVSFNVKLNFTLEQNFTDIYVDALRISNVMKIIPELYDIVKNNDKIMLCNKTIDIKLV